MSEVFYNCLIDCLKKSAKNGRISGLDETVWKAFLSRISPALQNQKTPDLMPSPGEPQEGPIRKTAPGPTQEPPVAKTVQEPCSACPLHTPENHPVSGEGGNSCLVLFVGEAPGADAEKANRPFTGAAAEMLSKMAAAMGLGENGAYFTNLVKCRPPKSRIPTPAEAACCVAHLRAEIARVKPQALVLLGAATVGLLFDCRENLSQVRGQWLTFDGIPAMATFHPNFLLREPEAKRAAWSDLKQVMKQLGIQLQRKQS